MTYEKVDFNEALSSTLTSYITPAQHDTKDIFRTDREISIARYALEQQAQTYHRAVEILHDLLEQTSNNSVHNPQLLTNIMMCISRVETLSQNLINSVKRVISILGDAVNLDVDKAALHTILLNLPSLVRESITHIAKDAELAEKISANLNMRITDLMVAYRFNERISPLQPQAQENLPYVLQEQYTQMFDSVPTQP